MVYRNKNGAPREHAMFAAYSLSKDFGAKQKHIAAALGCSQPTVALWVKEMAMRKEIGELKRELKDSKGLVKQLERELRALGHIKD